MRFAILEIKATSTIKSKLFATMEKLDVLSKDKVMHKTLINRGLENQGQTKYDVRKSYGYQE